MSLQASDYTALASLIVAVLALIATIWQARKNNQHSVLSVKPVLEVHLEYNDLPNRKIEVLVMFSNVGLGPAKIESWKYFVEDKEVIFDPTLQINLTAQAFYKAFPEHLSLDRAVGVIKGSIIEHGRKEALIKTKISEKQLNSTINRFKEVKLVIEYSDLYGNKQPVYDTHRVAELSVN